MDFTRRLTALRRRIGRRGASLLFLALLDGVYGTGLLFIGSITAVNPVYRFAAQIAPLPLWAAVWLLVGAVCLVQAFTARDQVAFGLAVALKVTWGGLTLIGWALHGVPRGYVSATIWLAFAGWVFIISGWADLSRDAGRRGEDR